MRVFLILYFVDETTVGSLICQDGVSGSNFFSTFMLFLPSNPLLKKAPMGELYHSTWCIEAAGTSIIRRTSIQLLECFVPML